jgi:hypothetical protein
MERANRTDLAWRAAVVVGMAIGTAGAMGQPDGDRAALTIPDDLWDDVRSAVGHEDRTLGYMQDEMDHYGRGQHRLATIDLLFRDVAALPRETGRITDGLLRAAAGAGASDPAWSARGEAVPGAPEVVRLLYALTDVSAGRGYRAAAAEDQLDGADQLPAAVRAMVEQVYTGAAEATPWIDAAFVEVDPVLDRHLERDASGRFDIDQLHRFVTTPWDDDLLPDADPLVLSAALQIIGNVDRAALAYGSVVFATHVQRAVDAYTAWRAEAGADEVASLQFDVVTIDTELGRVRIYGERAEVVRPSGDAHDLLVIDLGGDTTYDGPVGVGAGPGRRIGAVIDLGGNDVYRADGAAFGTGLFGIGLVHDALGNDTYDVRTSGLGCAWFGTGVLTDISGDDVYRVEQGWAQGHAMCGVGAVIDLDGDDIYECGYESQAHGSTLAAAALIDIAGDDVYTARDDGRVMALYLDQSVAMAQGCGHGRRADLDAGGHSLAGGWGLLVDGEGDDRYHSQVWSQGAGYWWGVGVLEDRSGNDHYRNGKYSLGAAAHFAIGVHVDLAGDDAYNIGNDTAKNQFHGHARDGSIGVAIDGDGDDHYEFRSHCAGCADLNSIALFWDRRGNDRYDIAPDLGPDNLGAPPFGSCTHYGAFRSFRDDVATVGVFLDTGGVDAYPERFDAGWQNDATWSRDIGPRWWSIGVDRE